MATSTEIPVGNIVRGIKSFAHSPDFSTAAFTFQMQNEASLTLHMDQKVLEDTATALAETCLYFESRRPTTTGHIAILALEAREISFACPAGGAVILRLRGPAGREYIFSLPVAVAAKLQPQLKEAVRSAERETKQPRQ